MCPSWFSREYPIPQLLKNVGVDLRENLRIPVFEVKDGQSSRIYEKSIGGKARFEEE
jgi:uncharacterized membrane-anchored protein